MKRTSGYYCYTVVKGDMKKEVTYLLVPPFPEQIRRILLNRVIRPEETVTFCRMADDLETYRKGDFKIEILSY